MPILAGPLADRGTLFTIDTGPLATGPQAAMTAMPATDLASVLNPRTQLLAELLSVLGRKVDFVSNAIDGKFDGFVGSGFAIDIVNERHGDLFGHFKASFSKGKYYLPATGCQMLGYGAEVSRTHRESNGRE